MQPHILHLRLLRHAILQRLLCHLLPPLSSPFTPLLPHVILATLRSHTTNALKGRYHCLLVTTYIHIAIEMPLIYEETLPLLTLFSFTLVGAHAVAFHYHHIYEYCFIYYLPSYQLLAAIIVVVTLLLSLSYRWLHTPLHCHICRLAPRQIHDTMLVIFQPYLFFIYTRHELSSPLAVVYHMVIIITATVVGTNTTRYALRHWFTPSSVNTHWLSFFI